MTQIIQDNLVTDLEKIETTINQHPGISYSVALIRQHPTGGKFIMVYCMLENNTHTTIFQDITSMLEACLPGYNLPAYLRPLNYSSILLKNNGLEQIRSALSQMTFADEVDQCIDSIHHAILTIWKQVFCADNILPNDNFHTLGGNSIIAALLINRLNKKFQLNLVPAWITDHCSILEQADAIRNNTNLMLYRPIITFNSNGDSPSFYMIHPGIVGAECYAQLATLLNSRINFYGIDAYNLYNDPQINSLELLVEKYAEYIVTHSKTNSVILGGWSSGGTIAYAICCKLQKLNIAVQHLFMIEPDAPNYNNSVNANDFESSNLNVAPEYIMAYIQKIPLELRQKVIRNLSLDLYMANTYRPTEVIGVTTHIFEAMHWEHEHMLGTKLAASLWKDHVPNSTIIECNANHLSIMSGSNLEQIARYINQTISTTME